MKIAIAGATGFVGSRLVQKLHERGDTILVLTRDVERGRRVFPPGVYPNIEIIAYQPKAGGDWQQSISGCDGVVNLAGAPIADERWTPQRKQEILASRIQVTQNLVAAIASAQNPPRVLVNASAIGYYGTSETATFDESSPPGNDFLAEVSQKWEAAALPVKETGTRLVILRLGIVLGDGGAIAKMITPFRLYAGGPLGSGKQWFSWIHREDVVNLILAGLDRPSMEGAYNATAPNPVRMEQLCNTLGEVMNRPSWLPVPDFALELLLGEAAKAVLEGQQVLPKRVREDLDFEYRYPNLKSALAAIVR